MLDKTLNREAELTPVNSLGREIKVLIIDDEEDDFILTSEQIRDIQIRDIPNQKFRIEWCSNYKSAVEEIISCRHDIYFIDYRLGGKTGLDLLRETAGHCEEPIVLLTGQGNQAIDLEAMRLGAVDYLVKADLNPEKLERCIRYALDRSATLKASRASERKYRNIFEKTRDVIFITSSDLKIRNINEAAVELFGYEMSHFEGKSLLDLMAEQAEREELQRTLSEHGKVDDFQAELTTRNNAKKVALISASRETDQQGQAYVQGILHDISLLKKAEEINLQAEKLEAKGRVIRTLAHEIRNPLNNISVSIDQLKTIISPDDAELLNIVYRGVRRIDDLINQLMDSSRYYKMKFTVMPLQTVLDKAVDDAMDRINLKKIKVEVSYPPLPAMALIDLERIKIAFLNILLNAVEAMEEAKGHLKISLASKEDFHEVTIADNGCGMSEEITSHLFEPYFTAKPNGVGLGLPSALAIIQSHKGAIHVESKPNDGTVFTITFPAL
jgi:PAS domain S-box-containing protein